MKYVAYESKVATSIQWLNEIPRHWGVERLKTAATYCVSNVDKVPADDEMPVRLCKRQTWYAATTWQLSDRVQAKFMAHSY